MLSVLHAHSPGGHDGGRNDYNQHQRGRPRINIKNFGWYGAISHLVTILGSVVFEACRLLYHLLIAHVAVVLVSYTKFTLLIIH